MRRHLLLSSFMGMLAWSSGSSFGADVVATERQGHMYLGAIGGATWFNDNGTPFYYPEDQTLGERLDGDVSFSAQTGFLVGGVLGYHWNNGLRSELELSYSKSKLNDFDIDNVTENGAPIDDPEVLEGLKNVADLDGDLSITYLMGNLWYGFGGMMNMSTISPYAGGGMGVGFVNANFDADANFIAGDGDSETGFAYQVGGGLLWEVSDSVEIDMGYRYRGVMLQDYDENFTSHSVLVGLNFGF